MPEKRPALLTLTALYNYLAGFVPAYFLTTYFSSLFIGLIPFLLISLLFQIVCGTTLLILLRSGFLDIDWHKHRVPLVVLAVAASVPIFALIVSLQFPGLYDQRLIFMEPSLHPIFFGLTIISTGAGLWLFNSIDRAGLFHSIENLKIIHDLKRNRAGILLAVLFFLAYFNFTQQLNFPGHYTRDQYFETDISDWIKRLTSQPPDEILPVRAVHPAVLLILRPLTWLLSIPLNGDRLQAAFILSALAGSACVFMTWLIVKQRTGSTSYALVSASLLGASASHLLLSSMLETYIFSALALISFCFLLQNGRISLRWTIPMGVVIFGITITNLAQACILYFLKLPRVKVMIQFIFAVILTTLLFNVLQVRVFPFSRPLYEPSNLLVEQNFGSNPFKASRQVFVGRVKLISRSILLYGIAAPSPYILTDEIGTNVPTFRTFKITAGELQVAGYKGISDITVKTWIVILGAAILLFITDLFKSPKQKGYHASLALCMGFSFGLHVLYGDDPMLYTPNWIYALVLFVSSSFERWADNKWLQLVFVLFLGMMIYTNLELIHQILRVSLPYYGR